MSAPQWNWLDAVSATQALREGSLSAEMLVDACIERVQSVDAGVQAWAFFDPEHARAQARALDQARKEGKPPGPLHGIPVGIKDIVDTADMPTEDGTVLHSGRRPTRDAAIVAMLRSAGALVFGKTVTTELATYSPGKTRNPHNPKHTPGGSSSGSAAAVAAGMVPLAVGTQTNGSVIRPAAFCGVVGFKPTHGLVPRTGILRQSRALDTVGVMARTVLDVAALMECIAGYDAEDADSRPLARIPFVRIAREEPPLAPSLAFARTPIWERVDADSSGGFAELTAHLGDRIRPLELPESLRAAWDWHRIIMEADIASSFALEYERGADRLSESLRRQIERGRTTLAVDYLDALARIPRLNESFEEIFSRYDAIVTPAAPGAAPEGLESTGDPSFCTLWTLCGMPAITLPIMSSGSGLPIGVQLVGQRGDDARLLRTANWLMRTVSNT
jgi:Asp-tRNA(Asn)/Glu-tRNA(Gln) amidotransferase A subunit family amidase